MCAVPITNSVGVVINLVRRGGLLRHLLYSYVSMSLMPGPHYLERRTRETPAATRHCAAGAEEMCRISATDKVYHDIQRLSSVNCIKVRLNYLCGLLWRCQSVCYQQVRRAIHCVSGVYKGLNLDLTSGKSMID